jgi:hypothetical protein
VAGLNENHKRRILASFQRVDELLSQSLNALMPAQSSLYSRCVHDITQSEFHWVESCAGKIRKQMGSFLERFQIAFPPPSTPSSWMLKTNLTSLDIALEEIYPEKMKGYGEMDRASASDLTRTLQEIRGLVSRMLVSLADESRSQ